MSEQATEVKVETEMPAAQAGGNERPPIDQAFLEQFKTEALNEARKIAQESGAKDREKLDRIAAAIADKPSSNYNADALLEQFGQDPLSILNAVADFATERGRNEALKVVTDAAKAEREHARAFQAATKDRPDLRNEDTARWLDEIYQTTDPALSVSERAQEAVKILDLRLEKIGAPTAEERIKKAQSSISSASASPPAESARSIREKQSNLEKESQQKRREEFMAKRGLSISRPAA